MTDTSEYFMTGIIQKKGKHSMQGYKKREFTVDKKGIMKYGKPGEMSKWKKVIKLSDIIDVSPQTIEPRHSFMITKKDGRILYFVARNDEEKWKWINGFRRAIRVIHNPHASVLDTLVVNETTPYFIPLMKLSKYSSTGIWRWRFFKIEKGLLSYYGDPAFGQLLGSFMLKDVVKINYSSKFKYSKFNNPQLQVDVKTPEKRSYFFQHPNVSVLEDFANRLRTNKKK